MKKRITVLGDDILSRCHVGEEEGGQEVEGEGGEEVEVEVGEDVDVFGQDVLVGVETSKEDDVGKAFDLNSEADDHHCEDVSTLHVLVPYVVEQSSSHAFQVDLMKLYRSVTYFGVPYRYY